MNITVGTDYTKAKATYFTGTRVITIYDLVESTLNFNTLSLLTIQRTSGALPLYAPSLSLVSTINYSSPSTTCTAGTPTTGGSMGVGNYSYVVTFTIGSSETIPSIASNVVTTTSSNKTVALTNIPLGPTGTVSRQIYRTNVGGTVYYLITTLADNTTTTFSDTTADNTTTLAPTTSYAYDITYVTASTLASGDIIYLVANGPDNTVDYNQGVQKTVNQVMSELPPLDSQVAMVTDTNLAINTYFYEIPASGWRSYQSQIKATCSTASSIIRLYATLDNTIAVTATAGTPSVDWVEITLPVFGKRTVLVPTSGTLTDIRLWSMDIDGKPMMYDRFMLSYQTLNATNFIQVTTKQF